MNSTTYVFYGEMENIITSRGLTDCLCNKYCYYTGSFVAM